MLLAPSLRPSTPTELELPLIAAQPGVWMGDQLSSARNAYIVAQYVELNGEIDVELLRQTIRIGLAEADTVYARFVEKDEVCNRHLATIRKIQPRGPYRLLSYSLGGVVAQAIAARLVEEGDAVEFLGLLDTYPPEIQDWSRPPTEDEEREIEKERALFMNASKDALDSALAKEKAEMFGDIMRSYEDSVRLLATARTALYSGAATLFVAKRTLPQGMDVQETWRPYVGQLHVVELDCAHTDIVSPRSLQALGPILNDLLRDAEARG